MKKPPMPPVRSRILGFQARIAEFLLLIRLRARLQKKPRPLSNRILDNANQVVLVTCKHWFLDSSAKESAGGSQKNCQKPETAMTRHDQTHLEKQQ